jgi:hypothetical protein
MIRSHRFLLTSTWYAIYHRYNTSILYSNIAHQTYDIEVQTKNSGCSRRAMGEDYVSKLYVFFSSCSKDKVCVKSQRSKRI